MYRIHLSKCWNKFQCHLGNLLMTLLVVLLKFRNLSMKNPDISCVIQARGSCASFVFGFVTFMSIGGFPSFVEDMKVKSFTFKHFFVPSI